MATKWSAEEDEYLLANYNKHDVSFLAKVLERSETAITRHHKILVQQEKEKPSKELEYILSRAKRTTPKKLRKKKGAIETTKVSTWKKRGNAYSHTRSGFRADLGINVRSGWEANVLRVLKSYDIPYDFEPKVFYYPIKRGNRAYTPDIYLKTDEWIEVKGWLDKNSEIKLKRFKKYYPDEFAQLTMIIGKSSKKARDFCAELGVPQVLHYEELSKLFKANINTWEGR